LEGFFEHGNESSNSIKCWEVFEQLNDWRFSRSTHLHRVNYLVPITFITNCFVGIQMDANIFFPQKSGVMSNWSAYPVCVD
jgi:hypothetical protein